MDQGEFQLEAEEVRNLRSMLFGDQASAGDERRGNKRFHFPAVQLAVPLVAESLVAERPICKVQCFDLSRGGIAFYWPEKPDFTHVCIGLGSNGKLAWLKARVAHSRKVPDQGSRHLVGCAFVERIDSQVLARGISAKVSQRPDHPTPTSTPGA